MISKYRIVELEGERFAVQRKFLGRWFFINYFNEIQRSAKQIHRECVTEKLSSAEFRLIDIQTRKLEKERLRTIPKIVRVVKEVSI